MNHYEWKEKTLRCPDCGWAGHGRDAEPGEFFNEGAEYHCPTCNHYFGFVPYPTLDENVSDTRAEPADRMAARMRMSRLERFEKSKLSTPRQLPKLNPVPTTLAWDVVTDTDGENYVRILNGDREIWRELSWYENYERFAEVAQILGRKYGPTLRDLVPTSRSEFDLYGDRLVSLQYVARVRNALAHDGGPNWHSL